MIIGTSQLFEAWLCNFADEDSISMQGNIAKWLKKEGDKVAAGDVLCEIEMVKKLTLWAHFIALISAYHFVFSLLNYGYNSFNYLISMIFLQTFQLFWNLWCIPGKFLYTIL